MTDSPKYARGLKRFDPAKHEQFASADDLGYAFPTPEYPVDKSAGLREFGMGGNGPDDSLTVRGGPFGNCGPNAVPKNVDYVTAALLGEQYTELTSDQITALYFTYQAELAGIDWRPPTTRGWTPPDGLDNGVDLGEWLLWLFSHDEQGNAAQPGKGLVAGFVKLGLHELDGALQAGFAVVVGVNLNPQADEQFPGTWDVGPGDQPNPDDGHAITYLLSEAENGNKGYATWGGFQYATPAWQEVCPQQAFAVFTDEQAIDPAFPKDAAIAALTELHGTTVTDGPTPAPSPAPTPEPSPTPVSPPTDGLIAELESLAHEAIGSIVHFVEKFGGKIPEWTGTRQQNVADTHDLVDHNVAPGTLAEDNVHPAGEPDPAVLPQDKGDVDPYLAEQVGEGPVEPDNPRNTQDDLPQTEIPNELHNEERRLRMSSDEPQP